MNTEIFSSTMGFFFKFLPNLEYTNLAECQNLCDAAFRIILTLPKLESMSTPVFKLYISEKNTNRPKINWNDIDDRCKYDGMTIFKLASRVSKLNLVW